MVISQIEQSSWAHDIDSFTRWKTFLSGIKTPEVRKRVIGYLEQIRARWPQHISHNEIPLE